MNLQNFLSEQELLPVKKKLLKIHPNLDEKIISDFFQENNYFECTDKDFLVIEEKFQKFLRQGTQVQQVISNSISDSQNDLDQNDSKFSGNNSQVGFLDYFDTIEKPKSNDENEDQDQNLNEQNQFIDFQTFISKTDHGFYQADEQKKSSVSTGLHSQSIKSNLEKEQNKQAKSIEVPLLNFISNINTKKNKEGKQSIKQKKSYNKKGSTKRINPVNIPLTQDLTHGSKTYDGKKQEKKSTKRNENFDLQQKFSYNSSNQKLFFDNNFNHVDGIIRKNSVKQKSIKNKNKPKLKKIKLKKNKIEESKSKIKKKISHKKNLSQKDLKVVQENAKKNQLQENKNDSNKSIKKIQSPKQEEENQQQIQDEELDEIDKNYEKEIQNIIFGGLEEIQEQASQETSNFSEEFNVSNSLLFNYSKNFKKEDLQENNQHFNMKKENSNHFVVDQYQQQESSKKQKSFKRKKNNKLNFGTKESKQKNETPMDVYDSYGMKKF